MDDFFFSRPSSSSPFFPGRRSAAPPYDYTHPYFQRQHYNRQPPSPFVSPMKPPANFPARPPADHQPKPKSRVVSIPVHSDVESSKALEEEKRRKQQERAIEAAVRIQRAVRGFLVRKNMKIVRKIEGEAEEIAARIAAAKETIMREEKERVRFNEMLMRLLFRLDEVRGVREYRRRVIRRVIALQELVDSISSSSSSAVIDDGKSTEELRVEEDSMKQDDSEGVLPGNGAEAVDESVQPIVEDLCEGKNVDAVGEGKSDVFDGDEGEKSPEALLDDDVSVDNGADDTCNKKEAGEESVSDDDGYVIVNESGDAVVQESLEAKNADAEDSVSNAIVDEMCEGNEENLSQDNKQDAEESEPEQSVGDSDSSMSDAEEKSDNNYMAMNACHEEIAVDDKDEQVSEAEAMNNETTKVGEAEGNCTATVARPMVEAGVTSKSNSEVKNVMEKVMAESERLQKLVAALCERSAEQCSLMAGLMERVEHLEQVVQKMEKKKKKRNANNLLASPNDKKSNQKKR